MSIKSIWLTVKAQQTNNDLPRFTLLMSIVVVVVVVVVVVALRRLLRAEVSKWLEMSSPTLTSSFGRAFL